MQPKLFDQGSNIMSNNKLPLANLSLYTIGMVIIAVSCVELGKYLGGFL